MTCPDCDGLGYIYDHHWRVKRSCNLCCASGSLQTQERTEG